MFKKLTVISFAVLFVLTLIVQFSCGPKIVTINTSVPPSQPQQSPPPRPSSPTNTPPPMQMAIEAPSADLGVNGQKKFFSRSPYSLQGNLLPNSDFSQGTTGYTPNALTDKNGNPLYSVVTHNNKNWLRLDNSTQGSSNSQGFMAAVINVPPQLRNSVIEISFLVCGYFTNIKVNGEDFNSVMIQIDPNKPERIFYYFRPNGAATFTLKLNRTFANGLIPGTFVDYTDIMVKEATYKMAPIVRLPASGSNIQFARWVVGNNWDEAKQDKILASYKQLGSMFRIWISSDLFASYKLKTPVRRSTLASKYLSPGYNNLTVEKVPTGIDPAKLHYLDWLFNKCQQYGLKVHIVLGACFTDGGGNPHATLATPGTYEFIDSDQEMRDGIIKLYTSVVNRYKSYSSVVGWELINEGFGTWSYTNAGINVSTPFNLRSVLFPGYRSFERQAYAAVKAADPVHPVIFNGGSPNLTARNCLDADDVCDWVCPSLYPGAFAVDQSGIKGGNTFTPSSGYGQILSGTKNGYSLIVKANPGSPLPNGLVNGQRYYVTNVTSTTFQLAETPGGSPITVSGGSGSFNLYADDGTGLEFVDYLLRRMSDDPKFVYCSEFGAYDFGDLKLYRNDNIDSKYISSFAGKVKKYGLATLITYDELNLMLDTRTFSFTNSGKALMATVH